MEENLTDGQKAAIVHRIWQRQQICNVVGGPISYLMKKSTFATVLDLANANVSFSTPNWGDEMFHRLGWKDAKFDDFTITADMNGCVVRISSRCEGDHIFVIRYGGETEEKSYQHLTGQVISVEVITPEEFVKLLSSDKSPIALDQVKKFHVCRCHGSQTPIDKQCMCHWCHGCSGVKPEYAERYRNSQWYMEVETYESTP